jgi:hypothetical protein
MKYSRKPLVLDIHRVEPVGDEVDNIDEVHFLFNTPFEANHFFSRNSGHHNLHRTNKSKATLRLSGCLRSEATLGPSVCLSSTPVITRPVVWFLRTEPRL